MERRDFLKSVTVGATLSAAATGLFSAAGTASADEPAAGNGEIPYRPLGRTGERVSAIGLGGYHIGVPKTAEIGIRIIRTAIDRGINFMDNSWDYNNGASETRMGKALKRRLSQKGLADDQDRRPHPRRRQPARSTNASSASRPTTST